MFNKNTNKQGINAPNMGKHNAVSELITDHMQPLSETKRRPQSLINAKLS